MSMRNTSWLRLRRALGPVTRRVPYGHVVSESATYARLLAPRSLHPERRFVIFAQGRSGSTLLADLVNSHPDVYCADEILTWKRRDPVRYAEACAVGHRGETYGFKVKIYHLTDGQGLDDPGSVLRVLSSRGWKVLHLQRRNILRQALSSMIAGERRLYHQTATSGAPGPVTIDAGELLRRTAERGRFCEAEAVALAGVPHVSFTYEDDLLLPAAHQATADRVFDLLGIARVPVDTELEKIADKELAAVVANAAEVRAAVAASPYAELLERD